MCECLVMLLFNVMYFGIGRFSFCSYATCIFISALVSKGQISVCNICPILKPAIYKYHIIIIIIIIIINELMMANYYDAVYRHLNLMLYNQNILRKSVIQIFGLHIQFVTIISGYVKDLDNERLLLSTTI